MDAVHVTRAQWTFEIVHAKASCWPTLTGPPLNLSVLVRAVISRSTPYLPAANAPRAVLGDGEALGDGVGMGDDDGGSDGMLPLKLSL